MNSTQDRNRLGPRAALSGGAFILALLGLVQTGLTGCGGGHHGSLSAQTVVGVTAVVPDSGPFIGGTTVTVTGVSFTLQRGQHGPDRRQPGRQRRDRRRPTLTCITPAGTPGATVDVVVTNSAGQGRPRERLHLPDAADGAQRRRRRRHRPTSSSRLPMTMPSAATAARCTCSSAATVRSPCRTARRRRPTSRSSATTPATLRHQRVRGRRQRRRADRPRRRRGPRRRRRRAERGRGVRVLRPAAGRAADERRWPRACG